MSKYTKASLAYARRWRKKHPKYGAEYTRNWRRKHPRRAAETQFRSRLKLRYNWTPQHWRVMLKKQKGLCAICSVALSRGKNVHVDHDHSTGEVRALLCASCNQGLGRFKDSPVLLQKAAKYLS